MPSFDIVSEVDKHELTNMIDQVQREIENRFDFKGTSCKVTLESQKINVLGDTEFHLQQLRDIILQKAGKRNIDAKALDFQKPETQLNHAKQSVLIKDGINTEFGKKICKVIKSSKIKVQASIQQEQVRVTGKKRDDLQQTISFLKTQDLEQPLQFQNFRD
ncbi:MAG: YajQ family cyclic di-GMP-binding protein [Pseudomonadota bacterium]|nr:YajQ family cyclic di-GMP-binding protein [Pseudomonadota bacterium]